MSKCKDCIHFVACVDFWYSDYDCFDDIEQSKQKHANNEACVHFKPTADVVEVVRCKDCVHWGGTTYGFVCRKFSGIETKICMGADHYCSYGERREE